MDPRNADSDFKSALSVRGRAIAQACVRELPTNNAAGLKPTEKTDELPVTTSKLILQKRSWKRKISKI